MAELIVLRDPLRGGRERFALNQGALVSDELRRLFPVGIGAPFELYLGEAHPDCYLPLSMHERCRVDGGRYVLVVRPSGPGFTLVNLAILLLTSAALSVATKWLAPQPDLSSPASSTDDSSPNNQLAGQTNQLRAGARVPDILGTVRAYPDLFTAPIELWTERIQQIRQFFVLGVGDYVVSSLKVGETPVANITGAQPFVFGTTSITPSIMAVKTSAEISSLSLLVSSDDVQAPAGATFTASSHQLSTPSYVPLAAGTPIRVDQTTSNNAIFDVTAAAAGSQPDPPFLYTLVGPVVNESSTTPLIRNLDTVASGHTANGNVTIPVYPIGGDSTTTGIGLLFSIAVGNVMRYSYPSGGVAFAGIAICTAVYQSPQKFDISKGGYYYTYDCTFKTLLGAAITFPAMDQPPPPVIGVQTTYTYLDYTIYADPGPPPAMVLAEPRATQLNLYTDWYVAPMQNPDEVWVDISFPSGMAWYKQGNRTAYTVAGIIEVRRLGAAAAQATVNWSWTESTQGYMRWTVRITISQLALPAGSPYIQVRVQRTTPFTPDDANNQYIADTRWERLAAMHAVPAQVYPKVTILELLLNNTRSAVAAGGSASTFNCIATRVLPTWNGSAWTTPAASNLWADALIARMKATDGANKTDAEIDIAGIYAIQTALNAGDSGAQGQIALTLDQVQDIDTELQLIASIVRGSVYRIGRKLYVTRDQGGKTPVALFTGRSKSPDGESLTLTLQNDAQPDAVIVQWVDAANGYKVRSYQFPTAVTAANPLTITPAFASWAQAWRRSQYEWNKLQLRRDGISVPATDEARLLHLGDVINVTDDVANLAQSAGELWAVSGLVLTLDRPITVTSGYSIMLRSTDGRTTDVIGITQTTVGNPYQVTLARAAAFPLQGRGSVDGLGTMYAIYNTASAVILPWLVTGLDPQAPYIQVGAVNYRSDMFAGDTATLPSVPPINALELDGSGNVDR